MAADGGARNLREQAAADARTRILEAAVDCIVRDGLAQVRMASIARTAGVSSGLLHYHFDTKELLFGEVLTRAVAAGVISESVDIGIVAEVFPGIAFHYAAALGLPVDELLILRVVDKVLLPSLRPR